MKFNGLEYELIIGALTNNNHFPSIDVPPLPLFSHLSVNTTSIVSKSRCHTISGNKFIREVTTSF